MKNSKLLECKIIEILYRWVHREEGLNPMPTDEIISVFKQYIKAKMPDKDKLELIPLNEKTEPTWNERSHRGAVNYNYGWNEAIQETTEALLEDLE